jgi:hypothetical protein
LQIGSISPVFSQQSPEDLNQELTAKTKAILLKELDLERLNTNFRIASMHDDKWRGWRQFAYSMSNAGLTEAGLLTSMIERYKFLRQPPLIAVRGRGRDSSRIEIRRAPRKPMDPDTLRASAILQMVGNCIGATGDVVELGVNCAKYRRNKKAGLLAGEVRKQVQQWLVDVDRMIAERETFLDSATGFTPEQREIYRTEGKVLKDIRDLGLLQNERYYLSAKGFSTFQISVYLIDFVRNMTGATTGVIGLYAIGADSPRAGGTASLFTTISGACLLAIPTGSRLASYMVQAMARRRLSPDLKTARSVGEVEQSLMDVYEKDLERLTKLASQSGAGSGHFSGMDHRLYAYAHQAVLYSNQENLMVRQIRQDLDTTLQSFAVAGTGGSTKITNGVTGMIAGWQYPTQQVKSTKIAVAGNTTYAAGTAAQMLEVVREKYLQQVKERQLRKQGLLPHQMRVERLKLLDTMEKLIND